MKSLLTILASTCFLCSIVSGQRADVVYTGGKIYTVNEQQPWAEAVAVKHGKFIKVGSADDVKPLIGDQTQVVDLGGNMVMPGILDLHSHPFITPWYGQMNLSLKNPGDPEKILEEVKAYADANPDKEWILADSGTLESIPTMLRRRSGWTRSFPIGRWFCSINRVTRPG